MALSPFTHREARYRRLYLKAGDLLNVLASRVISHPVYDVLTMPILDGLPAGTEVLEAGPDWNRKQIGFTLWNATWDIVPDGDVIPEIRVEMRAVLLKEAMQADMDAMREENRAILKQIQEAAQSPVVYHYAAGNPDSKAAAEAAASERGAMPHYRTFAEIYNAVIASYKYDPTEPPPVNPISLRAALGLNPPEPDDRIIGTALEDSTPNADGKTHSVRVAIDSPSASCRLRHSFDGGVCTKCGAKEYS